MSYCMDPVHLTLYHTVNSWHDLLLSMWSSLYCTVNLWNREQGNREDAMFSFLDCPLFVLILWADLMNRVSLDLELVIKLVQAVCQVVHCAGAQRTAVSSWLVGWVFRPLGSDIDVSAGGQRERQEDINPHCSTWVVLFYDKQNIFK